MILYFLLAAAFIAADQLIKLWALRVLRPMGTMEFLPGILRWTYVENRGAAFGIFAGQRWILSLVSLLVVAACFWLLWKKKFSSRMENICIALIAAGGMGNLIDRVLRGFVVDYIDINELFSYPMFNLADCCVVVGAVMFAVLSFLSDRKRKETEDRSE